MLNNSNKQKHDAENRDPQTATGKNIDMHTTITEQWRIKQLSKSHDSQNLRQTKPWQTSVRLPTPKELTG